MHACMDITDLRQYAGEATVGRRGSIYDTCHFYRMQRSGMRLLLLS